MSCYRLLTKISLLDDKRVSHQTNNNSLDNKNYGDTVCSS